MGTFEQEEINLRWELIDKTLLDQFLRVLRSPETLRLQHCQMPSLLKINYLNMQPLN
jgi:hypothetical protein